MAERETGGSDAPIQTTAGEEALSIALEPLTYGEAPRILILGDTRCGKTEIAKRIAAAYLARERRGIVLVGDDKDPRKPQFSGQYYRDPDELKTRPPRQEPRVLVFRGDQETITGGGNAELYEAIARYQWSLSREDRPSLAVYDELDRAASGQQWLINPSAIGWAYGKGGGVGAGSVALTQETEAVPREPFNQTTCIIVVRMMGNPIRLLKKRDYLIGGAESVIQRLPGTELPPNQRGHFVVLVRGRPWNQKVYRFGARRIAAVK
jgi:hypothetical protein